MNASPEPTVLVTGATGTVGEFVVEELGQRECTVRALSRDPPADDEHAVAFDFTKPETWGRAFEGGDTLFVVRPPDITRVGSTVNSAIDAAIRSGVHHVVVLSVLGAERNPLLPHRRIERHVADADCTYTFLRASFFMQNFDEVHAADIRERDELFVPAGDGTTSFVDARDVAAVAAEALTEHGHVNRAYDLTGPEALDYHEVAAVFSDVLGRDISYRQPGALAFGRRKLDAGEQPGFVLVMLGIYTTARLGLAGRVSDDVSWILGRDPRPLAEYVADYRAAFTPATGEPATEVAHVQH
ncbi:MULTISPECIES: NmrA family NAD(P)-binding protein [Salinibaculum]|uniref:NmrA family NAD(P)-binding protein n=1 Tax=Salinibaculum TaxID=2732368 RepID=UPI0030CB23A2